MELNEEVLGILKARGGLLTEADGYAQMLKILEAMTDRFKINLEYASVELYKEKPRRIEFGWVSASELNAFAYADPSGQFDFIGINVGAALSLQNIFDRLLSHPLCFPEVGRPELEDASRSHIPFLASDIFVQDSGRVFVKPLCPTRMVFASILSQTAMDFLFFHELTHLRFGHLEFLRGTYAERVIEEATSSKTTIEPLISQALEMDADCGAILYTLNMAVDFAARKIRDDAGDELKQAIQSFYGTPQSIFRHTYMSVYIMFRLFDLDRWDPIAQPSLSYPQPPIRQHWVLVTVLEILKNPAYKYSVDSLLKEYSEWYRQSELAIGLIQNRKIDAQAILSVITSHLALAYLREILDTWANIRGDLLPHVRGGKLAPAQPKSATNVD